MISYHIPVRICAMVAAGQVTRIIEEPRAPRHVLVGEPIGLIDPLTKRPIFDDAVCLAVERTEITWTANRITGIRRNGAFVIKLDAFAGSLGYVDAEDMSTDFAARFRPRYFEGFLITWSAAATSAVTERAVA